MRGRPKGTTSKKLTETVTKYSNPLLDKHRHFYDFYHSTGQVVNFNHDIQAELLAEYRKLVNEYYYYNNNCPVCVIDFLNLIYRWYDNK